MGMDLIPVNEEIESFHANWSGWTYITKIFLQLATEGKVEIARLSGFNDGEYVNAKTARKWGRAMLGVLEENGVRNAKFEDKVYVREEPILIKRGITETILRLSLECPDYRELVELDKEDKEWLTKFANFCIDSKGFRQC